MSRSILWFRHGLRLHDNPALLEAIKSEHGKSVTFYPVFIFDGYSAGTVMKDEIINTCGTKHVGYNRMKFLLECLADLDKQFKKFGGPGMLLFRGDANKIFRKLRQELGITKICYEHDCEPIWNKRDRSLEMLCEELDIKIVERVSHTLWNPMDIIRTNGGFPPLTYQMFLHTVNVIGQPPKPVESPDFSHVIFGEIPSSLNDDLGVFEDFPKPEDFGIRRENMYFSQNSNKWKGGEKNALELFKSRLKVEEIAFSSGSYLPNQANSDLLNASTSLSPALRFGCLSVRKFYYAIHDLFNEVQNRIPNKFPGGHHLTGQLIWREYFYTMSVQNPNYGQMRNNPICLNIPWSTPNDEAVLRWKLGRTGIPIIDAAMRQLLAEGWLHHTLRNIVATFLTRTGLWISWEVGLAHFLKYLLDADWSVCAGNWMWVSSSAFEKLLDSSRFSIIAMAYRLDPKGEYIKRYIPELRNFSREYIHEPWKSPLSSQRGFDCIIGEKYPEPIVNIKQAMEVNGNRMRKIRESLIESHPHVRPSNEDEIRTFFWIADDTSIKVQN